MDILDFVTMELFPCVGEHMQKLMMDSSPTNFHMYNISQKYAFKL